jgi:16S rRNA (cytosine1402-N4)-methyltransferase
LDAVGPNGFLLGIDRDPDAIAYSKQSLRSSKRNVQVFHDNFTHLPKILSRLHITAVDGILLDLGLSLYQLEASGRGFSFRRDEPLDMRMNPDQGETAETFVNRLPEKELRDLIFRYGEERWAPRIAKSIVRARREGEISSSLQLARIVKEAIPSRYRRGRIDPATRTFQAFRIAVNHELESLEEFLGSAVSFLNPGGRLCVLSFHSLEDRIVKERFRALARGCTCPPQLPVCLCGKKPQVSVLTKRPMRPGPIEVQSNPMARSAKLRTVERLKESGS